MHFLEFFGTCYLVKLLVDDGGRLFPTPMCNIALLHKSGRKWLFDVVCGLFLRNSSLHEGLF